jgi:TRAP-type C4-dicarboxylate transport system substrate-binding protein
MIRHILGLPRLALASAFTTAALFAGPAQAADPVVIQYSPWLPANHSIHEGLIRPWISAVERVTEGRVTVEFLPQAVGKPAEQFDVVADGLADMGVILPGYTPGRFPLLELGELPLLSSDAAVIAPAFYRAYTEYLEPLNPLRDTHVLTIFSTTPNQIVTDTKIIESLADFNGLKLRAPTVTSIPIINAIGALPVQKPVSEMYELASNGIVDGTFFAATAVRDWKLGGLLPYMTEVDGGIGQPVMAFLLNEQTWNSISEADRAAIMSVSGEVLAQKAGENYANSDIAALVDLKAEGLTVAKASPALMDELRAALAPVEADWIARAGKAGLEDPAAILKEFRAALTGGS